MRITVQVRPNSAANAVTQTGEGTYKVLTTATPENGKANEAVITLLAKHFRIAKSRVNLVFGKTAREKIVDIEV